jgi:hypothetical protein
MNTDYLDLGGAVRVKYLYQDWNRANKERGGDFDLDTFRLNVDASYKDVLFSAEYRFYSDGAGGENYHMLHPWLGPGWTDSLAQGDPAADEEWHTRFNINFGYYF